MHHWFRWLTKGPSEGSPEPLLSLLTKNMSFLGEALGMTLAYHHLPAISAEVLPLTHHIYWPLMNPLGFPVIPGRRCLAMARET